MEKVDLIQGDCLEAMENIPSKLNVVNVLL